MSTREISQRAPAGPPLGRRRLMLLGAAMAVAGCSKEPYVRLNDVPPPAGAVPATYRLGAGDTIRVTVFGQPDLSGEFLVDAGGQVPFPLLGALDVADRAPRDIETTLHDRLVEGGYLVDPKVGVSIVAFRPFYLLGEVREPGRYAYEDGLTVLKAVAIGGGFTYRGDEDDIIVYRGSPGAPARGALSDPIFPGDVIVVRARLI